MARYADTRSPSPVGSTHLSARRNRREEDRSERSRRDEDRHHCHRRRSRSRSPERRRRDYDRDRDRDSYRRRDRSVDRRRDDRYERDNRYGSRRDRSRDRRRSRDRDSRRLSRSPESEYRRKQDDSRDRDRKKRDGSAELRKRKREDSPPPKKDPEAGSKENSKPATPSAEDEKAARLKKLEEWKRKQAATLQSQGNSPKPATPPRTPTLAPPAPPTASPPTKKPATSAAPVKKPLGADAAVPLIKKAAALSAKPNVFSTTASKTSTSLKPKGNLSGFSIGGKNQGDSEVGKKGLDFKEEDDVKMKLEKLPTLPDVDTDGAASPMLDQDDDDDAIVEDDQNDEEAMAAARTAAEQRSRAEQTEDMTMAEAPEPVLDQTVADEEEEEEEEDPLDAFMQDLSALPAKPKLFKGKTLVNGKPKSQEPESFFNDDEIDMKAIEGDDPENIMAKAEEIAKKKKKDIGTVNHDKVKYEPFCRKFYTEPMDMQDWTEEDVANLRMELDNIKVRGVDVPKPVQTWAQCGLGVQVLDAIRNLGYAAPTSIQAQAIPSIMSGRDVIGVAKTGSGKTIAFLLPMFRHIKDQRPLESLDGPICLVLSPTRELATQIHKECKPFLKTLGLRAMCAYGGAPIKDQIAELKRGAEIVVCTPGRMIDLLAANGGRVTNLKRITYVVLDEADRMFDMGFEPQVMKVLANIRPDRQTVLFSATFPRAMEALARKTLNKPVEIVVGGRSVVAPEITQVVEVRAENTKFNRVLELLGQLYEDDAHEDDRTLIFVDRQESADGLLRDLMKKAYPCMSIHGGKDQVDRDSTIADFKAGVVPILIATSVAARGLDVKQLKLVINYDAPNHLEDYVHRAGRTGRAGQTGTAVTFLTEEQERYAVDIAKALRQSGQRVPESVQKLVDGFAEKVKAGKEKGYAGGFGGKGLERLDQQRDADKARERKSFKTGDEKDEEDNKEDTTTVKVGDDIFAKAASGIGSREKPGTPTPATPAPAPAPAPAGPDFNPKIIVHKTERPVATGSTNQMDKVAAAVAGINAKLSKAGVMRSGVPIDNKGPDAGAFHATLEINDFPQRARWAVTNRTNVAKILESTGTSITTKGNFYAAGKEPGPNDLPKLYILVEGDTELVVQQAMRELLALLKEGTIAASEGRGGAGSSGRYSVV